METDTVLIAKHSAQLVWKNNEISVCVCMRVMSVSYLALPLLQHCAYVSLLSVGPCCVSQTVGLQGVGTCMINTNKSTVSIRKICVCRKKVLIFYYNNMHTAPQQEGQHVDPESRGLGLEVTWFRGH